MKQILSYIFLTLCIGIQAQENDNSIRDHVHFGLKIGTNYSNVYDSEGEDFDSDPKFGLAAGAFLSIPIAKQFAIQPEILFSQKGFQATGRLLGSTYSLTRTTNFVDVPLLFAYRPTSFFSLVLGPQYSYLIKQRDVFTNGSTSVAQETEFSNDNLRKNILCITGGADININHLVLSARAGFDIQNNHGDGTSNTPRYKNTWLQATIGYRLY